MANKLKAGIIGCGGIANGKHMPSIKALGETELVAEINKAIAEVNEQGLYQQWMADATELAKSLGLEVDE